MRFRINFTWPNGINDSFVIEGDTIEEIRQQAAAEVEQRGATDAWSEQLG